VEELVGEGNDGRSDGIIDGHLEVSAFGQTYAQQTEPLRVLAGLNQKSEPTKGDNKGYAWYWAKPEYAEIVFYLFLSVYIYIYIYIYIHIYIYIYYLCILFPN
jgi:hypothetical protein